MCGRFAQLPVQLRLRMSADLRELEGLPARYNMAPTQLAGVVHDSPDGLTAQRLRWGLLPFWAKDKKLGYTTINARVETVAIKPAFRAAFKDRRALIPMAGYYEWTETTPKVKQPWYVHRPDGEPLWAAGLWEPRHKAQDEAESGSFTVITTTAHDQAGQIHDRMPVFLPLDAAEAWMRETPDNAQAMLDSFTVPPIAIYAVSRMVNNVRNEDPRLIEPIPAEEIM